MSYDITIKADDDYSKSADIVKIDLLLSSIAGMNKREQGYHFGDPSDGVYFEIDAYQVNREGNLVEHRLATGVNRVDIHIPAAFFDATQQKAAEVSCTIAANLGWKVFDEQTGEYLAAEKENLLIGHQGLSSVGGEDWIGTWLPVGKLYFKIGVYVLACAAIVALFLFVVIKYLIDPLMN